MGHLGRPKHDSDTTTTETIGPYPGDLASGSHGLGTHRTGPSRRYQSAYGSNLQNILAGSRVVVGGLRPSVEDSVTDKVEEDEGLGRCIVGVPPKLCTRGYANNAPRN